MAHNARADSSFTVTFKRYDGTDRPKPRVDLTSTEKRENMCLIRAKCKSKKISTVVRSEDVPNIMSYYNQFMRNNMDGLKRVKKVKNKAKATKS